MKPLISIIIPTWNCGRYIGRLLKSIANQTYDNMEVIIIDDASEDSTQRIVSRKIKTSSLPIYYTRNTKKTNANIARNIGLQIARGDYIFLCDADSHLNYNCLATLKKALDGGNGVFAYCDFKIMWQIGKHWKEGVHICGRWDTERMREHNYISMMCLWKRQSMPGIDNQIERMQEWDMFLEVIEKKQAGVYVPMKLFTVYMRENGLSRNKNEAERWTNTIKEKRRI